MSSEQRRVGNMMANICLQIVPGARIIIVIEGLSKTKFCDLNTIPRFFRDSANYLLHASNMRRAVEPLTTSSSARVFAGRTKTPAINEGEPTVIQRYFLKPPQLFPVSCLTSLTLECRVLDLIPFEFHN